MRLIMLFENLPANPISLHLLSSSPELESDVEGDIIL